MRRLFIDSIASRIILILFLGFTISHVASIFVFTTEQMAVVTPVDLPATVERIAVITRQLVSLPERYHDAAIAAADSSALRVIRSTATDEPNRPGKQGCSALPLSG